MAPPYVDDDPTMELTEKGLRIAENEKRDAVTDAYESEALTGSDTEETLDDISYPRGAEQPSEPELSAMRREDV
ncbi:MAG: hypothetical protein ABJQ93_04245 [Luteolibacter sp.]